MPIGEDIPMLIPVSIILTVIVLFLLGTFADIGEKNDLVRMSQTSLDTLDYASNILFSDGHGNMDYNKLRALGAAYSCQSFTRLNLTMNYKMKINVSDSISGKYWCWKNMDDDPEKNSITNYMPTIIINDTNKNLGKVTVIVSK